MGCVTKDENVFRGKLDAVLFLGASAGEVAELVTIVMIVGVGPKLEIVPDAVVRELEFGSAFQVAREQGEDDVGARLERLEQSNDPGQETALGRRKLLGEEVEIAVEKRRQILRRLRNFVRCEHAPGDAGIRASGDLDGGQIVVDPEAFSKAAPQRPFAGAAGSQQRAIDIEEDQLFGHSAQVAVRGRVKARLALRGRPRYVNTAMRPRTLVLLLAIAALIAKIYCAATTIGTSDVASSGTGLAGRSIPRACWPLYRQTSFFNHTPLVGWFSRPPTPRPVADGPTGEDKRYFVFYLRLPAIFADFFAVIALLWLREKTGRPAWWALAIFAASPVAFMVSGYHGNVDSVMALGILLAAVACATDHPAWCGFSLGLACNIKVVPLLLAPVFFFLWWQRRQAVRFAVPAVLTVLVGWSYPLLTIPAVFLKSVLGYGSIWGVWGVTYALRLTNHPALRDSPDSNPTPAQVHIMTGLKLLIVLSALLLAWRGRQTRGGGVFQTLTLIWVVFFVFTPGFGAQYLAWLAPCFVVANERWYAALTAASSVALFAFYTVISGALPWRQGFTVHAIASRWTGWLVLPWLTLVAFLIWEGRRAFMARREISRIGLMSPIGPIE